MKKFLLSMAVALMAIGAQAETIELTPTAPNAYWGSKCVGMGTVDFSSQWGEFVLGELDPTVYSSVKIEYTNASSVQFKVPSPTEAYGDIADGDGSATINISEQASTAKVELQGKEASAKITVTKLTFVKADGSEEAQETLGKTSWGCSFSSRNILYTNEGGELGFTTYPAVEEGKKLVATITFDAAPAGLRGEIIVPAESKAVEDGRAVIGWEDKYYVYLTDIEAGATSYSIEIDYAYTSFTIKAGAAAVNATLSNVACTAEISSATGIEAIEDADDAEAINLFGQKANEAKGFMVKGGKKVYVK